MSKYKHVKNVLNEGGKTIATMHVYDKIGKGGVEAKDFVNELKELNPDRLNVRFNTIGGDVVHGFGILSAMLEYKKNGGELHTYNDGVAASTGGWLLLAAKYENIHAKDYAILMLHGVKNDTKGGIFEKSIINIFKNRTGLDVRGLMTNGQDNFFDASESSVMGFLPYENIENSGLEFDIPENMTLSSVTNMLQNIENTNNKPLKMKQVINLLKLQEGASEEVIVNAVKNALQASKDSADALLLAQNELTEKDGTIEGLRAEISIANTATATSVVENGIREGKFTPKDETAKNELIRQAAADPKAFNLMLGMMTTKAANVLDDLGADKIETTALLEKINNRSLRELEKQDPSLLLKVKNEAKEVFVGLWNKQYKTEKTIEDFA